MEAFLIVGLPCLTVIVLIIVEGCLEREHIRAKERYADRINRRREVDRSFEPRPAVWYSYKQDPVERSGDVEKPSKTAV